MYYYPINEADFESIKNTALGARAAYVKANAARDEAEQAFKAGKLSQDDLQAAQQAHKAARQTAQEAAHKAIEDARNKIVNSMQRHIDPADMDKPDYRILRDPAIKLSAEDLLTIKERNADSALIRKAIEDYAVEANFDPMPVELFDMTNVKDVAETLESMCKCAAAVVKDVDQNGSYGAMMLEDMNVHDYLHECNVVK